MKKQIAFTCMLLAVIFWAQGCSNPKKLMYYGNYDEAIEKSVQKLRKDKNNEKYIAVLEEAYIKATQRDNERIVFLKKEGKPDNWRAVYDTYVHLAARQEKVKPLLPLTLKSGNRTANIAIVNYTDDIIDAKQKATEYLYTLAVKKIDSGSKQKAREAYRDLQEVKRLYPNFKDTEQQMQRARILGTSFVLIDTKNSSGIPIPPDFERQLVNLNPRDLNSDWVEYHLSAANNIPYDYDIIVNLQGVEISPEAYHEKQFEREREIVDGWVYAKDSKGNYILDSLGNKIKTDKFVRVSCRVTQIDLYKEARLGGSVDFFNRKTKQRLLSVPVNANAVYAYAYATINGDRKALDDEKDKDLLRLANNPPAGFPPDFELIMQTTAGLQEAIAGAIRTNRSAVDD